MMAEIVLVVAFGLFVVSITASIITLVARK